MNELILNEYYHTLNFLHLVSARSVIGLFTFLFHVFAEQARRVNLHPSQTGRKADRQTDIYLIQ